MRGSDRVDIFISLATRGNNMFSTSTITTNTMTSTNTNTDTDNATTTTTSNNNNNISSTSQGDEQKEGVATTTDDQSKPRCVAKVNSLEEVDRMSVEELRMARLAGASRRKLTHLIKSGMDYIEAKRTVIKDNFIKTSAKRPHPEGKEPNKKKLKLKEASFCPFRQEDGDSPKLLQGATKAPEGAEASSQGNLEARSQVGVKTETTKALEVKSEEVLSSPKVAVVLSGFPQKKMDSEGLKKSQESIILAMCNIPIEGPEVRFHNSIFKPGYLLITCEDKASADWLKSIVPTLRPWEGATLNILEGDNIPGEISCTVFIPDENGQRPTADRILTLLRVSNRGLNTALWTMISNDPSNQGQLWTFLVDQESFLNLRKLDMNPFFGLGKVNFQTQEGIRNKDEKNLEKNSLATPTITPGVQASTSTFEGSRPNKLWFTSRGNVNASFGSMVGGNTNASFGSTSGGNPNASFGPTSGGNSNASFGPMSGSNINAFGLTSGGNTSASLGSNANSGFGKLPTGGIWGRWGPKLHLPLSEEK